MYKQNLVATDLISFINFYDDEHYTVKIIDNDEQLSEQAQETVNSIYGPRTDVVMVHELVGVMCRPDMYKEAKSYLIVYLQNGTEEVYAADMDADKIFKVMKKDDFFTHDSIQLTPYERTEGPLPDWWNIDDDRTRSYDHNHGVEFDDNFTSSIDGEWVPYLDDDQLRSRLVF
jgi:hypothetical protein